MDRPILVTGTPRSGKTMIARVLEICGVFVGKVDVMMENVTLREELMKPYLVFHGGDPLGICPLPEVADLHIPPGWKEKVENLILGEGYDDQHQKWMFKGSSIALNWPVWEHAYPYAKYVIVRRRTGDIIQSCLKTDYMEAHGDDEDGWKGMIHAYEERLVQMINAGLDCKVIWPHRMVYGDYAQVYELLDWLRLPWKTEVLTHIDPKFWKIRKKEKENSHDINTK